jgi:hypothetical protein
VGGVAALRSQLLPALASEEVPEQPLVVCVLPSP